MVVETGVELPTARRVEEGGVERSHKVKGPSTPRQFGVKMTPFPSGGIGGGGGGGCYRGTGS